jgi:hypothetical protein
VETSFDSYDKPASYPDCEYIFHVKNELLTLVRRVESQNLVSSLLWPKALLSAPYGLPIAFFEWLAVTADVFLTRYIPCLTAPLSLPTRCTNVI